MPLAVTFAYKFVSDDGPLRRLADKALKRELRSKAAEVLQEARASIHKGGRSAPGHPFTSQSGATKRLLGMRVGKRTAFVGFRADMRPAEQKGGKGKRQVRVVPNILEHGSRRMAPRPVLEPALERVKSHPWKGKL